MVHNEFHLEEWRVIPARQVLARGEDEVRLSHKAMAVLLCLAEEPGAVVSKEDLFERVWEGRFTSDEVLTTVIYELRRALGDRARQPRFVETIRKRGYRLVAEVKPLVEADSTEEESEEQPEEFLTDDAEGVSDAAQGKSRTQWLAGAAVLLLIVLLSVFALDPWREPTPPEDIAVEKTDEEVRSLAVLPLADLDGERDRFADALTEQLVSDLAAAGGPEVLPSLMTRGAERFTLAQVASELEADAVVEGSVVRSGDRLWISVQLVDVRSGRLLWGGAFEREAGDALELQRELSREIVGSIRSRLWDEGELEQAADALELGTYFLSQGTVEGATRAQGYFRLALELDPELTAARVGLADSYLAAVDAMEPAERPEAWRRAREELAVALELDALPSPPVCREEDPLTVDLFGEALQLCLAPEELSPELDEGPSSEGSQEDLR